jgi:glycine cleavage system H protein
VEIGISDHAQHALGDLVFVGARRAATLCGDACAVVESVKAASDVYSPIAGTVVAVNESSRCARTGNQMTALADLRLAQRV